MVCGNLIWALPVPDPNPFTAMVQSGRELRKRWLRLDETDGTIWDGTGRQIAAAMPGEARKTAAGMVAAYNESIAKE